MQDSTGAILSATAGSIAFANEWVSAGKVNFRIAVATPLLALFMYGVGKISAPLAAGLGGAVLVTVLVTPFNGQSPLQSVINITGTGPTK